MTKPLRTYPENARANVVSRRILEGNHSGVKGNGYWAAVDYLAAKKKQSEEAQAPAPVAAA
jgi:hypothetical protein